MALPLLAIVAVTGYVLAPGEPPVEPARPVTKAEQIAPITLAQRKPIEVVAEVAETSETDEESESKAQQVSENEPQETQEPAQPTAQTYEATAYTAFCDTGCTGVTASGYDVSDTIYSPEGYRVIAADPAVLPLGSTVRVSYGERSFKAKVLDKGAAIKGRRIDLLVGDKAQALEFGRRDVSVEIIE